MEGEASAHHSHLQVMCAMANQKPDSETSSASLSQQSSLVFVNVSNPAAIDSQSVRRLVRSSATRHSHRDPTRKPKARKADRRAGTSRRASPSKLSTNSGRSSPEEAEPAPALIEQSSSLFSDIERAKIANIVNQYNLASEVKVGEFEQYASAQPNNSYSVDAEEWFPWVLSFYRAVHLPRGINLLQRSPEEGEAFITWFMAEGRSEPALFYMQLLTACTQLVDSENSPPQNHVDWLRGMVVSSINEAIGDPSRMTSTATLLAVAFIAMYEFIHGDNKLATQVHARAFVRMLEMRGGVDNIALPRLAWKLLQWTDQCLVSGLASDSHGLTSVWIPMRWRPLKPD